MSDKVSNIFTSLFRHNGVYVLLAIALILALFVTLIALFNGTEITQNGSNSPTPTSVQRNIGTSLGQKIAPSQKAIIEKTTQEEVEKLPSLENKTTLANDETKYTFTSPFNSRKNEIIVRDNQVVFERVLVPISRQSPGYVTISEYKKKYGQPQEVIKGSYYYGNLIETFIYANKGFTLIGNSFTDEVFEVQTFPPTTVENYKQQYGQDINKEAEAGYR